MDILNSVKSFKDSVKYNSMITGERYFTNKSDILNREFYYYPNSVRTVDIFRANNKIVDNFFRMLIEQKVSYCLSKGVVIENYIPIIDVNETIDELAEEASIKGIAWAHPYINDINMIKIAQIPAQEIIPIYGASVEKPLEKIIRFYESADINYVEVWTDELYQKYEEGENGYMLIDEGVNIWDKVPFIQLQNNRYEINDLENIKALIDSYDKCISDFANNFEDFQDIYYKLKNYAGSVSKSEDVANILEFIKQNKMIPVSEDGDFEAIQLEVPYTARETYLKMIRELIFLFGQGVDTDILSGGSLTNVVIKARFSNLDQKCNKFLKFVRRYIENLMYFDVKFKEITGNTNTDMSNFNIVFNTTSLINEAEKIDCVVKSDGIISEETNISNHPWVDNVEEELKKKSKDELDYKEDDSNDFELDDEYEDSIEDDGINE